MKGPLIPSAFRKDLKLYAGPKESDGSPTYNLYDPVRAKYFKLSWEESLIYKLAREGMGFEEIAAEVKKYAPVEMTAEEIAYFFDQAAHLGLLNLPKGGDEIYQELRKGQASYFLWFVMNYLYLRVPLIYPDAFLERTLPRVRWLWSPLAIWIYAMITLLGLAMVMRQWEEYIHTFTYFFTFQGLILYSAAIFFVKFIHEFSHAYTAKSYGIKVPTMGAAFIVLWPVLYTDVTDSWKLKKRGERLLISMAGIISELVIAGISTMGWVLSPPGIGRSIFFVLSSVTWVSSLLINCNPVLRFDGYYILCDLWGIDNLRPRAFAVGKWKMREFLYGLQLPCPEGEGADPQRLRWMCVYSYVSWIYLLIIYTAVALFVYYKFTKALGILLFFLEIAIFFVWPVVSEVQELYRLRRHFRRNLRTLTTFSLGILLLLWIIIPIPHTESFVGITVPEQVQTLYVPAEGVIEAIDVKRGDRVVAGQPLIKIRQFDVEMQIKMLENEIKLLDENLEFIRIHSEYSSLIPQKEAELTSVKLQLQSALHTQDQMTIRADISGLIYDWDETLRVGQPVAKDQVLGKVGDTRAFFVTAFVPENQVNLVEVGQEADFVLLSYGQTYEGKITSIEAISEGILEHPALASLFHGPLPVVVNPNKELKLSESFYRMHVVVDEEKRAEPPPFGAVGDVRVTGNAYSILGRTLSYLYSLFLKESSL